MDICTFALSAAADMRNLDFGKHIHTFIKNNNINYNLLIGNTLLNMYVECGDSTAAISMWKEMCNQGVTQDYYTYSSALTACANLVLANMGEMVYKHFCESGLESESVHLDTALLNMYAKTGSITKAKKTFVQIREYSKRKGALLTIVPYNTMLTAYPIEEFLFEFNCGQILFLFRIIF